MTNVPLLGPAARGVNVTDTVQELLGVKGLWQVVPATKKSEPDIEIPVKLSETDALFVRVTVLDGLVDLAGWLPNDRLSGVTVGSGIPPPVPVPFSEMGTVAALFNAFVSNESVPVRELAAEGANTTDTEHALAAVTVIFDKQSVSPELCCWNAPDKMKLLIASA